MGVKLKYLIAYKFSLSMTNGEHTIEVIKDEITQGFITLTENYSITEEFIQKVSKLLEQQLEEMFTIEEYTNEGYFPEVDEVLILAVTRIEE